MVMDALVVFKLRYEGSKTLDKPTVLTSEGGVVLVLEGAVS
jgi:hypothetical protein